MRVFVAAAANAVTARRLPVVVVVGVTDLDQGDMGATGVSAGDGSG